ncbi:hypothetical protein GQ55_1G052100 [Panicum hallii var. hallii]|uniref:Knottins-like domain-containing protein n=1 Tax=Panicum hallii var. hallii TaxID=1504633 RepID=A0A2T7F2G7_9POAL|nr:hypothetical protein GQ55_1G052100 [Panicum hallii var. hallii]
MKGKITATASMFLLLLLLLTFGAEADRCETRSKGYKGTRCNNHNCWAVCITEGNTGGFCKRMGTKCVCTRSAAAAAVHQKSRPVVGVTHRSWQGVATSDPCWGGGDTMHDEELREAC